MEPGKYFNNNQKKLQALSEDQVAAAIEKCRVHIGLRINKRTSFGAHTAARLGMDPYDYYVSYAYDAILFGHWEWKDKYTFSQQMIRIAESTISTEVEKVKTKKAKDHKVVLKDPGDFLFVADPEADQPDMVTEILINKKISIIEETIKGDADMENYWECIKEGMKTDEIAEFLEKTSRQVYKLKEKFVEKIKQSPYFEDL